MNERRRGLGRGLGALIPPAPPQDRSDRPVDVFFPDRGASPPVLDTAFPSGPDDDKLDGLFRLFDYLLDNDVKMGTVSINDIRTGKRDKIVQVLKALRAWEDKRKAIAHSLGPSSPSGSFLAMAGPLGMGPA